MPQTVPTCPELYRNTFTYHTVQQAPPDFSECFEFLGGWQQQQQWVAMQHGSCRQQIMSTRGRPPCGHLQAPTPIMRGHRICHNAHCRCSACPGAQGAGVLHERLITVSCARTRGLHGQHAFACCTLCAAALTPSHPTPQKTLTYSLSLGPQGAHAAATAHTTLC